MVLFLLAVLVGAVVLRLYIGGSLSGFTPEAVEQVMQIRWHRASISLVVGGCLGAAGVVLQSLLRNPLASPDVLGPSSGASLAVMLATFLSSKLMLDASTSASSSIAPGFGGLIWQAGPALIGATLALALVYSLSQRRGRVDSDGLIIVGVIVSVMCGAGVVFIQHLINASAISGRTLTLLVGSISDDTPAHFVQAAGVVALLTITLIALTLGRAMDVANLSDDEAASVGVPLARLRLALFISAGLLTACAVVLAGPIGFVGLICPHLVRLMLGPSGSTSARLSLEPIVGRAGVLLIASALCGAALLVLADVGVRAIDLGAGRMPVGVLTALLGGPMLIVLLRRSRRTD